MASDPERDLVDAFNKGINQIKEIAYEEIEVSLPALPGLPGLLVLPSFDGIKFDSREFVDDILQLAARAVADKLKDLLDAKLEEYGLVDTGNLKNSLSINIVNDKIDIQYSAPYAGLLHEGGYILPYGNSSAEKVFVPGRPWINDVLRDFDYDKVVNDALNGYKAE